MTNWKVPFSQPRQKQVITVNSPASGDGEYSKRVSTELDMLTGAKSFLTPSGTAALELATLAVNINAGDEVIVPSFTFSTTASSIALRGGIPVFVDVDPATLNIDPIAVENAITPRTVGVMAVHYAGVSCDLQQLSSLCKKRGLWLIEDAAQGIDAYFNDEHLGTIGSLGCLSFHDTKNISSGEGGALLLTDSTLQSQVEILREKGTNRSRFLRGEVDKYTWESLGSSYLMGEPSAAYMLSQLVQVKEITQSRLRIWEEYRRALVDLADDGLVRLPSIPKYAKHNAHIFYVVLSRGILKEDVMEAMKQVGIQTVSHYVPLHSSPAGVRYGRVSGTLHATDEAGQNLLRLPLHPSMWSDVDYVLENFIAVIQRLAVSV